jgi:DNA transposition AAA+ family ATPase
MNNAALQTDSEERRSRKPAYNEDLHARFISWMKQSGNGLNKAAHKLARSAKAITQYIDYEFEGDLEQLEQDARNFLRLEEEAKLVIEPGKFCDISLSREIWDVFQFCQAEGKQAGIIGFSGCAKTRTAVEFKKRHMETILVTLDVTKRSLGSVLSEILYSDGGVPYAATNSIMLNRIIRNFKHTSKLLIIDESQFASWEVFEAIRTIWDNVRTGIVYLGTPRLYAQMKGRRGFLWDQILSRFAVQKTIGGVSKTDVKLIADSIHPGLSKSCLEFLHEKARAPGRLRTMIELLNRAVGIHERERIPLNLQLLKEIDDLLSF